jgi:hypothetical protein
MVWAGSFPNQGWDGVARSAISRLVLLFGIDFDFDFDFDVDLWIVLWLWFDAEKSGDQSGLDVETYGFPLAGLVGIARSRAEPGNDNRGQNPGRPLLGDRLGRERQEGKLFQFYSLLSVTRSLSGFFGLDQIQ